MPSTGCMANIGKELTIKFRACLNLYQKINNASFMPVKFVFVFCTDTKSIDFPIFYTIKKA